MTAKEELIPSGIPGTSKARLRSLPQAPGVYLMKDSEGKVIYVGKAKQLRSRVRSYFSGGDGRYNVEFLMKKIVAVDTIVTADERQALILESDLIKQYKPRYNVRLKDDKAHYMVRINVLNPWPRLELVRSAAEDGARYFGPYAFGYELRVMLDIIKKTIPLRTCADRVMHNRLRPCLEYQIKRCAGPCCLPVDQIKYGHWVEQAIAVLEGKNDDVLGQLEEEMERASREERFEEAATIRDRIAVINNLRDEKPEIEVNPGTRDAVGIYREDNAIEFTVVRVRQGRLYEGKTYGFTAVDLPDEELLASFLSQFYGNTDEIPDQILLTMPLEDRQVREELYSERKKRPVKIVVPKRGRKAKLLSLAVKNAEENFRARAAQGGLNDELLRQLKDDLGLEEIPRTIECVDISHFQGGATVGSVVLFQDGVPDRNRYRRFHLSQEGKPDDFSSMHEIILRHLSREIEENGLADLIVIDGGVGQLNAARAARKELGLSFPVMIALAKRREAKRPYHHQSIDRFEESSHKPERVYLEHSGVPVILNPENKALHLLERIRNEAHRFAISFHRTTRTKRTFRSALDSIPGIGPARKKHLLRVFGSIQALKEATPEELTKRAGLPDKLSERVFERLHREPGGAEE